MSDSPAFGRIHSAHVVLMEKCREGLRHGEMKHSEKIQAAMFFLGCTRPEAVAAVDGMADETCENPLAKELRGLCK